MSIRGRHSDRQSATGRWIRLEKLLAAQHGVVSRAQLTWLGWTESAIKHRVATQRLVRIQRSVYAVGHDRLTTEGRWMAAVLTYGEGALLSHRSAAAHWDLLPTLASRIDITVPSPRRPDGRVGIRVHRTRLHPADSTLRDSIPVTSPSRTLLDLGDVASHSQVRNAYEASLRLGLFDLRAVRSLLDRSPGRRGLKSLGDLLAERQDDPPELRSGLEGEFRELLRAASLPLPSTNAVVEGILVDAYWPQHKLVVELDTYGYHSSRERFERDHDNTERLQNAGLRVRRFTRRRVQEEPHAVIETLRTAMTGG